MSADKSLAASLVHRFQRAFLAAAVALGPAAILVAALTNPPYYGGGPGEASAIATNATSSDLMDQTHLVAELIAAYLLPIGFLVMAWLANRAAPILATVGGFLAGLGFIPLALYVGQDSLYYDIARLSTNMQLVDLAQRWNHDPIMSFYGTIFGLGTVFGPTFIGLALWRSNAVPWWAAACITFSRLPALVFLAVPYHVAVDFLLIGVVLMVVGSGRAALAVLEPAPVTQR